LSNKRLKIAVLKVLRQHVLAEVLDLRKRCSGRERGVQDVERVVAQRSTFLMIIVSPVGPQEHISVYFGEENISKVLLKKPGIF
jgi:hypothetical protein